MSTPKQLKFNTKWRKLLLIVAFVDINRMVIKSVSPYYSLIPLYIVDVIVLIALALPFIARLTPKNPTLYAFILALRKAIAGKKRQKR